MSRYPNTMIGGYGMNRDRRDYDYRRRDYRDYRDYGDYRDYEDGYREYRGYYGDTPFEVMQNERSRYDYDCRSRRDYHSQGRIGRQEMESWIRELLQSIDEKDKEFFNKEKILKKSEEMGIKFNEFTPEEFYATTLMEYTDYCKTMGSANIDLYIRMAKDWLMDEDSEYIGGEKLAAYYYHVIRP